MDLRSLSYFGTGGTCQRLFQPRDVEELSDAFKTIQKEGLPYFFLGAGTNSLVSDEDWEGAVIVFSEMKRLSFSGNVVTCGAGVVNSQLAEACRDHQLKGVAWMYRLPGQVGATVRMNARCYGGEISQVVSQVTVVLPSGERKAYENVGKNIFSGYKDTIFMRNGEAVAEVVMNLAEGVREEIQAKMLFCESDRVSKGQFLHPTCGCVFKNDYSVGVPSGMLLEASGAKLMSCGNARVSPDHANFVYNQGASSRDILELTLGMREAVYQKFGVWLSYEMEVLGKLPTDLSARFCEIRAQHPNATEIEIIREKFQKK